MNSNDDGAKGEAKETKEGGQSLGKLSRRVTVVNRMRNLTARGREWADEIKDKGRHMKGDSFSFQFIRIIVSEASMLIQSILIK
jgi:hypothetical protein